MRKTRKSGRLRKWSGKITSKIEEDKDDMEMVVVDDEGKIINNKCEGFELISEECI